MENLHAKLKNHGKKVIIHLKRHHRKYLFGALCSGILALIGIHTASTINSTFADAEDHGTDIILQATVTESGQTLRINKYFTNDYTVDRGDGITGDLTSNTTHTYNATGTYNITLSLSGADRWTFTNNYDDNKSLVPMSGTTVTGVQIVYMPSLAEGFGNSADAPGDYFFYFFNADGALTSLPEGSFDTSNITTAGDYFFSCFNGRLVEGGALTNLPAGSFNISNITIAGDHFFSYFNSKGALTSLPTGSFDTSNITSAGNFFFNAFNVAGALTSLPNGSFRLSTGLTTVGNVFFGQFNDLGKITTLPDGSFDTSNITSVGNFFFDEFNGGGGALTSLPEGSFDLSNITTAGNRFFSYFNSNGALTTLPDSFKLSSVGSQSVSGYQNAFNSSFTLNKNVSALVSGITAPLDDRNVFSDNQPGRCGVHTNRLTSTVSACSITYKPNGGSEIVNPMKKYTANTTGVVAGDGIETPSRTGYAFSGWYTAEQGGDLVDIVVFPNMDDNILYAQWSTITPPICIIKYSTTGWTNQTVTATLTGCSKTGITVLRPNGSWTYPFASNGNFTFEFRDAAGNTGSTNATVSWIDKDKPSCSISYETQGESGHESTTARLTGCSENVTVTNTSGNARYYVLGYSGTFTFQFKDRANNTGKAIASYNMPKYTIQVNNSREMLSLFTGNGAISCEYNYNSGNYSQKFVIYIKTGAAYAQLDMSGTTLTYGSELFINDKIYQWGSYYSSLGSGEGIYTNYDFNVTEVIHSLFGSSSGGTVFMCATGIDDDSVFDLPNDITFYSQSHYAATHDIYFSIIVDDSIKAGEYNNFTVKVVKNGQRLKDYDGRIYFELLDENGDLVDDDYYVIGNRKYYDFGESDNGRKTFTDGLKINKAGTYILRVYDRDDYEGTETIVVKGKNGNMTSNFEYDTLKFDSGYSTEMNMAYQFARYYDITTINNIKDAKMSSGLNRIAMAKMLANYAENVLGIDDFDTSRNCNFTDVPSSLDKDYDYGVTKACQLGIMGVNMKSGKFYPKGGVTRAEFATALSRLLYNTSDGTDKYYSTHIYKLYREGIITNTDPDLREKRGYVMLMLMRASEDYDY